MKRELIIAPLESANNNQKGKFFEELVGSILDTQRYQIKERINFTGMEIDLICKHKDRDEIAYAECKSTESLSSADIHSFTFKVNHRDADYGYFIYTNYFEHQVGGLIEEMKNNKAKYRNLYFWDVDKTIELMSEAQIIRPFNKSFDKFRITKIILIYSQLGAFYVPLLTDNNLPQYYSIYNAKSMDENTDSDILQLVHRLIPEVEALEIYRTSEIKLNSEFKSNPAIIESISEVQQSESWDDYKPAAPQYFIGRKEIIKHKLMEFFNNVLKSQTKKRAFFIQGKSGWGKSSIINAIRGKSLNKFNKNRLFIYAVDSRSSTTPVFIPHAFLNMLKNAINRNFIPSNFSTFQIPSQLDILGGDQFIEILEYLEKNQRLLVIIFDQFEDVFRTENLFRVFHKLLIDIHNANSNLIIGFSWKSEINIPIEHPSYHLWQQTREYAISLNTPEFDYSESRGIVRQLEKAINSKLDRDFIKKIIHNSQGFPWLVKKLCIHICQQHKKHKVPLNILFDQDFNVEELFKNDLEELTQDEVLGLKYIANRSLQNNAFDIVEIDEKLSPTIISALINKRLIIKSGTKYNIYWDIFRDYLATNEIPKIGEAFLLRQSPQNVLDMYLLFKDKNRIKFKEIQSLTVPPMQDGTILNILRDLRNIGLIGYNNDEYFIKDQRPRISEDTFKKNTRERLLGNSIYLSLERIDKEKVELQDISAVIKNIFKGEELSERTLNSYSRKYLHWIKFSDINMPKLSIELSMEAKNSITFTPQRSPEIDFQYFNRVVDQTQYSPDQNTLKILYDLKSIGLVWYSRSIIYLTPIGKKIRRNKLKGLELEKAICRQALKTEKIKFSYLIILKYPNISKTQFKMEIKELLIGINSKEYQKVTSRILFAWGQYIYKVIGLDRSMGSDVVSPFISLFDSDQSAT